MSKVIYGDKKLPSLYRRLYKEGFDIVKRKQALSKGGYKYVLDISPATRKERDKVIQILEDLNFENFSIKIFTPTRFITIKQRELFRWRSSVGHCTEKKVLRISWRYFFTMEQKTLMLIEGKYIH